MGLGLSLIKTADAIFFEYEQHGWSVLHELVNIRYKIRLYFLYL